MPSTASSFALLDRIQAASLAQLYNPLAKDLIHLKSIGNDTVVSVNSLGVVTLLPTTHTSGNLFGSYWCNTTSLTQSVAFYFNLAFPTNPQQLDIMQLWAPNGAGVVWHLDYQGVVWVP